MRDISAVVSDGSAIWAMMIAVYWLFRKLSPAKMDNYFRRLQLVSSALLSFSHGGNDAQKTAGIIAGVLLALAGGGGLWGVGFFFADFASGPKRPPDTRTFASIP